MVQKGKANAAYMKKHRLTKFFKKYLIFKEKSIENVDVAAASEFPDEAPNKRLKVAREP